VVGKSIQARSSRWALIRVWIAVALLALLVILDSVVAGMLQHVFSASRDDNNEVGATVNAYVNDNGNNIELQIMAHKMLVTVWSMYIAIVAWIACAVLLIRSRTAIKSAIAFAVLMTLAIAAQFVAGTVGRRDGYPIPDPLVALGLYYPLIILLALPTIRLAVGSWSRLLRTAGIAAVAVLTFLLVVGLSGQKLAAQLATAQARPPLCYSQELTQSFLAETQHDLTDGDRASMKTLINQCLTWANSTGDSQTIAPFQALDIASGFLATRPNGCNIDQVRANVRDTTRLADVQSNIWPLVKQCDTWAKTAPPSFSQIKDSWSALETQLEQAFND
jgi:hypothetical protein